MRRLVAELIGKKRRGGVIILVILKIGSVNVCRVFASYSCDSVSFVNTKTGVEAERAEKNDEANMNRASRWR
jgi:hypothetical protein